MTQWNAIVMINCNNKKLIKCSRDINTTEQKTLSNEKYLTEIYAHKIESKQNKFKVKRKWCCCGKLIL